MFSIEEFKKSRLYLGIKQEGIEEGTLLAKLRVVPLLLEARFTVEEIAQRLDLTVEQVQQAAQSQSN